MHKYIHTSVISTGVDILLAKPVLWLFYHPLLSLLPVSSTCRLLAVNCVVCSVSPSFPFCTRRGFRSGRAASVLRSTAVLWGQSYCRLHLPTVWGDSVGCCGKSLCEYLDGWVESSCRTVFVSVLCFVDSFSSIFVRDFEDCRSLLCSHQPFCVKVVLLLCIVVDSYHWISLLSPGLHCRHKEGFRVENPVEGFNQLMKDWCNTDSRRKTYYRELSTSCPPVEINSVTKIRDCANKVVTPNRKTE